MADSKYYQTVINRIAENSVESTVSMLGIVDTGLRKHLVNELSDSEHHKSFLADPVFESMFPWEKADVKMSELSGKQLQASLVEAMNEAGDHRFGKDWFPFKHQLKAWKNLSSVETKSVVVTSGTGSGKTECFMVPILNDLAKEYEETGEPLVGIRALFIYPLNALINSQRERLRAWTEYFDDGLRFCLYNGNTQENKHKDQSKYPNEILTRKSLRATPTPMLVTNATMLEYMLVRQVDEPIIEQSQGKLRWIVLDEAHTYMGSQAAELSLLLRRVLHTFGVEAENVRFVATSATIGNGDADKQLQAYLADLAGVANEQVVVVGGKRDIPSLPSVPENSQSLQEIENLDQASSTSSERYRLLSGNPVSSKLRKALTDSPIPSTLTALSEAIFSDKKRVQDTLKWIDICSNTTDPGKNEDTPYLPVRAHLFHQVMSGLWCCADKGCSEKQYTELDKNWPFGNVYTQRRASCECGSPIYELVFCIDCNEPHLMANEKNGQLIQYERDNVDEFSLNFESDEESIDEELPQTDSEKRYIAPVKSELTNSLSIERESLILTSMGLDTLDLQIVGETHSQCACCGFEGYRNTFRQSFLGTPFYISNTAPSLLDACQESDDALEKPARGRRLITFTDSRQGTARISTKIQQDSERDSIRGLVYGTAANINVSCDPGKIIEKEKKIASYDEKIKKYKGVDDDIVKDLEDLKKSIFGEIASARIAEPISWNDLVNRLQSSSDISRWIFNYYNGLNSELFPEKGGTRVLTEMLLLREFARRPKRQNSLETLGLVSIQYPALNKVDSIPQEWRELNLTLADWKDFLKLTLDFYVRENTILSIPEDWVDWMGAKVYPKTVLNPDSEEQGSSRIKKWPQVFGARSNRLIRLIALATELDVSVPLDRDKLNQILKSAWSVLTSKTKILKPKAGSLQYHLTTNDISFLPCEELWVCPITHRLLDTTFKGITPYLPFKTELGKVKCKKADISICRVDSSDFKSDSERRAYIREWVKNESNIQKLRNENLWTDISDKIVQGGRFFRAAEHSAQQPASRLEQYEALFKSGRLNILSCSTTMEMGVDIGGINVVAMNNVPPHPANYLQRAGRAGRRGETQALSFTICKDNPHERSVFTNPLWPFTTKIPAPYITLNSERIIQRHVNSLLLSYFLKKNFSNGEKSFINLNCEWFFVASGDDENLTPYNRMVKWLASFETIELPEELRKGINLIISGSVLGGTTILQIITSSSLSLKRIADKWQPQYRKLTEELNALGHLSEKDPYRRKLEYDINRVGKDYLLSEFASKSFLPGYGFPTGIATFDHYSVYDFKSNKYKKANNKGRIDNMTRMRERPGRDISVAIREYAPGADVVLDGLVYRSSGILLNKYAPDENFNEPVKLAVEWRCHECGHIEQTKGSLFTKRCSSCDAELVSDNIKEFIKPEGFSVDFYSSPSTDITSQAYIPVQEPWVTANSKISELFNPMLGSYKNSSDGHIFHHSSGEYGTGYAVCLRCGKSGSMTLDGEYPKDLEPMKPHKKLQGKPGGEDSVHCEGSDEAFGIKANVHLGGSDQTDVFEIYLKHPDTGNYLQHSNGDKLSWTLAVVLRQALADIHGINADEMGYTVKPSTISNVSYPVSGIALFDRCGGGAGFASAAPRFIKEMLQRARIHLDCSDNCETACQSCLMGYDTRFHMNLLDRKVAIEYVESISKFLEMPKEARVLGESTAFCLDGFDAEVMHLSQKGFNSLRLYLKGKVEDWNVGESSLKNRCLTWIRCFKNVDLIIPKDNLKGIDEIDREDLWALSKIGVGIKFLDSSMQNQIEADSIIAQLSSETEVRTFGSDINAAAIPSAHFWKFDGGFQVMSSVIPYLKRVLKLDLDALKPEVGQGDIEIEILNQCDGKADGFGKKLWKELSESHDELRKRLEGGIDIESISYSDVYISSPISFLLFAEVIDGLKHFAYSWNNPLIKLTSGLKDTNKKARGVYADWQNPSTQADVFSEFFQYAMDERLEVVLKNSRQMPHGRILAIQWKDGSTTNIRFDHGMGAWSLAGYVAHGIDQNEDPKKQVDSLLQIFESMKVVQKKGFATPIFIKHRH